MAVKNLLIKLGVIGDKDAKKKVKKIESSFERLGSTAMKVGGAFFAARGIISGLNSIITLAGKQEEAEKRLEVALGKRSQELLNQASALQKMTTFGDEAIIGVQASIGAFIKSEEQIKKATQATLDMAVAMGMDLKGAGDLIAKTLGSSTNAMSRYGIEVTGAVGSSERLESLTSNIAELFGGQASAQAETLTGKLEQTKNAIGDAGESLGELLAPAVIHTANAVAFLSDKLVKGAGFIAELIIGQEAVTETTKSFASAQGDLAIQAMNVNTQTSKQVSDAVLLNENNEKLLTNYANQTKALSLQILELEGASLMKQELFKLGIDEGLILDGVLKDELDKYIMIKNALKTLQGIKAKDALVNSMSFKTFRLNQLQKLDLMKAEESNIRKFIELYPAQAKALGIVNAEKVKGAETDKQNFASSLSGLRQTIKGYLAQTIAAGYAAEVKKKGWAGLAVGTAVAIAVSTLFDKYIPAFAEGGIVPGSGNQDTVPAMLTPGELILNQSQQDNLAQGMGVTINIGGNIIGEESFVRDTLIPEIEKARTLA
tara:strand:+ start:202 stop:1836 length:1635 start_codon:yes stop_codon:yes gene_type:complete